MSMHTPWGMAQTIQQLDEHVLWVETAEHGGILVEMMQTKELLSEQALHIGRRWNDFMAFEQESAIMVIFYEHPEWYPWAEAELIEHMAEESLHQHYPDYFSSTNT